MDKMLPNKIKKIRNYIQTIKEVVGTIEQGKGDDEEYIETIHLVGVSTQDVERYLDDLENFLEFDTSNFWHTAEKKPPIGKWVHVKNSRMETKAMACQGKNWGDPCFWRLQDGNTCHPSMFNFWREIDK